MDAGKGSQAVGANGRFITNYTDDGAKCPATQVRLEPRGFDVLQQALKLRFLDVCLENDNHVFSSRVVAWTAAENGEGSRNVAVYHSGGEGG